MTLPLSLEALVATGYLVSLATVVIPGPITLVATRLALAHRLGAAFWFLVGATLLDAVLFAALASGAGPHLARLGALPAVELAGGLVLLWGGLASARQGTREPTVGFSLPNNQHRFRYLFLGMGVSLANPHYWLWWVTAGLAFVETARHYGEPGLLWMLGALLGGVVSWYAPLLLALGQGKTLLSPAAERLVVKILAAVLVTLGFGLVALGGYRLGLQWGLPG
ncbi:MAG: LysE family transporter [Thermoanaerobaculum sp.]|nr:LysE family transporter [Thermoanaerobaculum sp.]MDW7967755.1 LysE family transporter [Thermoanaerobaculum sp.]